MAYQQTKKNSRKGRFVWWALMNFSCNVAHCFGHLFVNFAAVACALPCSINKTSPPAVKNAIWGIFYPRANDGRWFELSIILPYKKPPIKGGFLYGGGLDTKKLSRITFAPFSGFIKAIVPISAGPFFVIRHPFPVSQVIKRYQNKKWRPDYLTIFAISSVISIPP